jgi:chromosome segregation ATPase
MAVITKEVSESIRKSAKVFEGIIAVGAVLDQLGSLDQALSESQTRLDKSLADEKELASSIAKLNEDIKALTGKKSDAAVKSAKLLSDAEDAAAGIVANGKEAGAKYLADATKKADLILADAESKATAINLATAEALKALDAINAEIAEASKERTKLQKAIDAIKSKFA